MFICEIANFIKKRDYFIKKRISKKNIRKINIESDDKIKITYLNKKNKVNTFCINISESRIEKEKILEKLNYKAGTKS